MFDEYLIWIYIASFVAFFVVLPTIVFLCVILPVFFENRQKKDYTDSSYFENTKKPFETVKYNPGDKGEYDLYLTLRSFEQEGAKLLFNLYIPKSNGEKTEIDAVLICGKCVIVFENKNYGGIIYGNGECEEWEQVLVSRRGKIYKTLFYNPVHQNSSHIKWLRDLIGDEYPILSMIVFSDKSNLNNVTVSLSGVYVINRYSVRDAVSSICSQIEKDYLCKAEIDRLYSKLYAYMQISYEEKKAHSQQVRKKINRNKQGNTIRICPVCGNDLVVRTSKRGATAGLPFYGCKGYPKCRYTDNIVNNSYRW